MQSAARSTPRNAVLPPPPAVSPRSNRTLQHVSRRAAISSLWTSKARTFVERKDAGAALLKAIRYREFDAKAGEWRLGNIGGFELAVTAITLGGMKFARIELTMQRTGRATEIEYGSDLTALGLISRLEYCLGRFEVELIEEKRAAADAAHRLPPYRERLGAAFAFEGEIIAKRQELDDINASLAANNAGEDQVAA